MAKSILDKIFSTVSTRKSSENKTTDYLQSILDSDSDFNPNETINFF